jgi:MFS family permease
MSHTLAPRRQGALLVLCGALFLDALDVSMKSVALPSIGAELAMSTGSLQWIVSAYTLGFGGLLLLGGRSADLFGRRRVFTASLLAFLVASTAGGLAGNGTLLIVARFATGMSAAFTAPAGLAIIITSFADGPARNRALTIYSATGATGFALGLVAGGLLAGIHWRTIFFLPAVLAAAIAIGAVRLIPAEARPPRTRGFDIPGAVTATAALLALVLALVRAPAAGWASATTLGLLILAALLATAFIAIEKRTRDPLAPLPLLRSGALIRANIGAMALLGGWVGTLFILTLYMQQIRGWSPLQTGAAVAPTGIVVALLAPRIAAPLVNRFGTTPVILAGLGAAALAYGLLLPLGPHTSYPATMLPAFLLVGAAFALAYGPLTIAATTGIDADEQGVAGGLVNTSFQIGPALALAAIAAVIDAATNLRTALIVPLAITATGIAVVATGLQIRTKTRNATI